MKSKKCSQCDKEFVPRSHNAKVCSNKCRRIAQKKRDEKWREDNKQHIQQYREQWCKENAQHLRDYKRARYIKRPRKSKYFLICTHCESPYVAKSPKSKYCNDCRRKEVAARRVRDYWKSPEQNRQYSEQWRAENPDYMKEWRKDNLEHCQSYAEEYRKNNPEVFERARRKQLKRTDPNYKIARNIRSRVHQALKRQRKSTRESVLKHLGCTISELKQHLENQFQSGMTWDNYSHTGWHVDHIKPLSLFDLGDEEQLKEACHYSNLQPLWAEDNIRKSNKYE